VSHQHYNNFQSASNPITRSVDRRGRRAKLVAQLRSVCFLASHEAFDCNTLRQRCALVRLVAQAHDVLRALLNVPELNQAKPKPKNQKRG
jgi:hypothetical protein